MELPSSSSPAPPCCPASSASLSCKAASPPSPAFRLDNLSASFAFMVAFSSSSTFFSLSAKPPLLLNLSLSLSLFRFLFLFFPSPGPGRPLGVTLLLRPVLRGPARRLGEGDLTPFPPFLLLASPTRPLNGDRFLTSARAIGLRSLFCLRTSALLKSSCLLVSAAPNGPGPALDGPGLPLPPPLRLTPPSPLNLSTPLLRSSSLHFMSTSSFLSPSLSLIFLGLRSLTSPSSTAPPDIFLFLLSSFNSSSRFASCFSNLFLFSLSLSFFLFLLFFDFPLSSSESDKLGVPSSPFLMVTLKFLKTAGPSSSSPDSSSPVEGSGEGARLLLEPGGGESPKPGGGGGAILLFAPLLPSISL